jgi:hypothetical protein
VCDEGGTFPGALDGVWLFGWSGGMNHFSWVRLRIEQMGGGGAQFLSGADLSYNIPFWDCSGQGDWMLTAKPDTIGLYFPEGCALGFQAYTFLSLQPPSSTFPKGAILEATVEGLGGPGQIMQVYKFPAWQCDEAMTACQDPLH